MSKKHDPSLPLESRTQELSPKVKERLRVAFWDGFSESFGMDPLRRKEEMPILERTEYNRGRRIGAKTYTAAIALSGTLIAGSIIYQCFVRQ